ncbi:MAG: HAMP domain-containing sensor histidine kinase [Microbacteriaceae bacterium]
MKLQGQHQFLYLGQHPDRMLKPLQYIHTAVHNAAGGDLQYRIGLSGPRDEISELATNFDGMLEQLERSFTASKCFASNASHELLTPLATTRAMLDVAIEQQPDAQNRELFSRLQTMNERSIETAQALLSLAQIEASPSQTERVDLAMVAAELANFFAAEAAERGVQMKLDLEPVIIDAEPVLARQLISNLVQNAIRHNIPQDGFVTVRTSSDSEERAIVQLENSGAHLDPQTVAALAEPFVRAEGRTSASSAKGYGLGLSIVSAIVNRFRGTLELVARPEGGLSVSACFPSQH